MDEWAVPVPYLSLLPKNLELVNESGLIKVVTPDTYLGSLCHDGPHYPHTGRTSWGTVERPLHSPPGGGILSLATTAGQHPNFDWTEQEENRWARACQALGISQPQ